MNDAAFWSMLGIVLPVLIVQIAGIIQAAINNRKAAESQVAAAQDRAVLAKAVGVSTDELHQKTQAIVAQVDKP